VFNINKFIGDWGLGIEDYNPQSPIPNPQLLSKYLSKYILKYILKYIYKYIIIYNNI